MTKKRLSLFFISLLFISRLSFALQTDTEYIPHDKYFDIVLNEINSAKSSVRVFMYLISVYPHEPESRPARLVSALIDARKRGVGVRVILDQNIDFLNNSKEDADVQNKNRNAFEVLKENNVSVFFDEADTYTHTKTVIVDDEIVILGSANWSKAALTKNHETSVRIRSKELAQALLVDLSSIKTEDVPISVIAAVSVPEEFLTDERFLGQMVERGAQRVFDTYLYLLRKFDRNPENKISVDYIDLAKFLGMERMTSESYRRQIIKVLNKLESEYGLIDFEPVYAQDAKVILKIDPAGKFLKIPANFWNYGWSRSLSFAGKVMVLVNCYEAATSPHPPSWSLSVQALAEKYHMSEWFISEGTTALRRANLLEVEYAPLDQKGSEARHPSTYTPNSFYSVKERSKRLKTLETQWGKGKLERAQSYAALVYEDADVNGIESLLELEGQYGAETVKRAIDKIGLKNPGNPKRTMKYLIGMIRGMGDAQS